MTIKQKYNELLDLLDCSFHHTAIKTIKNLFIFQTQASQLKDKIIEKQKECFEAIRKADGQVQRYKDLRRAANKRRVKAENKAQEALDILTKVVVK